MATLFGVERREVIRIKVKVNIKFQCHDFHNYVEADWPEKLSFNSQKDYRNSTPRKMTNVCRFYCHS